MLRILQAILWSLLILSPLGAETFEIQIETYPPDAVLTDQFGGSLGRSSRQLNLHWKRANGPLQLKISKDGHRSVTRTVTVRELQKTRYPEVGVVTLPAESWSVYLSDHLKYHRLQLLFGVLLVSGLIVLLRRRGGIGVIDSGGLGKIGRYRLLEPIGRGATAEVFRAVAVDDDLETPVALKLMHAGDSLDPDAKDRFRREIQTSLKLKHPKLAEVYDWGEHPDGRLYLVTELLVGESLSERMKADPSMPDALVVSVLQSVGEALAYLHQCSLIHRDVKPSNVFLQLGGGVKLVDLGIAKGEEHAPLTQLGIAVGTPHYMAPEQSQGSPCQKSDQYSMGIMAFEMLTGVRPFRGKDSSEIVAQHLTEPVPSLGALRENSAPALEQALHKILAKNPDSRFADTTTAAAALCAAIQGGFDDSDDTVMGGV